MVMLTVSSFKVFDLIIVMTDGGPGRSTTVLSQLIYQEGIIEGPFWLLLGYLPGTVS